VTIDDADASVQWGMTANVGVMAVTQPNVALLPLTSIYHHEGKPAVWRYDPASGKVAISPVEIGQDREDGVLVTSGVRNGDWIVTAGVHKLIPGQVVRPYEGAAAVGAPAERTASRS
jgi:multidrug efflux system membrane fusion protein